MFQQMLKQGDLPMCDATILMTVVLRIVLSSYNLSLLAKQVVDVTLMILFGLSLYGHIYLYKFYKHCVTSVFNAELPKFGSSAHLRSHFEFYNLVRPLEIGWRLLTSRWRVLPDVLVLGEVRCGTTTLCAHLKGMGSTAPFCPWKHPELDGKETFYFAAHYLGNVDPANYALCFPFKPQLSICYWLKMLVSKVISLGGSAGNDDAVDSFFTFDGCAQYLTSPTAPYLIAEAYALRGLPPPVLLACVRDPVKQAVSWWKYEQAAMQWGRSMGLTKPNTNLRGSQYPPKNIAEALSLSSSRSTSIAYIAAEKLFSLGNVCKDEGQQFHDMYRTLVTDSGESLTGQSRNNDNCSDELSTEDKVWVDGLVSSVPAYQGNVPTMMPLWAGVWPGGQLAAIGRNGKFSNNIQRFESIFQQRFKRYSNLNSQSGLCFVTVVDLSQLADTEKLKHLLTSLAKKIDQRRGIMLEASSSRVKSNLNRYYDILDGDIHEKNKEVLVRNAGTVVNDALEPSVEEINLLKRHFKGERTKLLNLCKAPAESSFPWNT